MEEPSAEKPTNPNNKKPSFMGILKDHCREIAFWSAITIFVSTFWFWIPIMLRLGLVIVGLLLLIYWILSSKLVSNRLSKGNHAPWGTIIPLWILIIVLCVFTFRSDLLSILTPPGNLYITEVNVNQSTDQPFYSTIIQFGIKEYAVSNIDIAIETGDDTDIANLKGDTYWDRSSLLSPSSNATRFATSAPSGLASQSGGKHLLKLSSVGGQSIISDQSLYIWLTCTKPITIKGAEYCGKHFHVEQGYKFILDQ